MATTHPTRTQFNSYCVAFDYFNRELFGSELPPCILNFSRKAKAAGFFAASRWKHRDDDARTHEISLNPDVLLLPPIETMDTLVHEMVHLWQQEFGTPSRSGYHNKEWSDKMVAVGLMPSDTGQPGGSRVGQRMSDYVIEDGPFAKAFAAMPVEALLPWVSGGAAVSGGPTPTRRDKVTFECPECKDKAWGKAALDIRCGKCDVAFVGRNG